MRFTFSKIAVVATLMLGFAACKDSPTDGGNNQDAQFAASADAAAEASGFMETAAAVYSLANTVPGLTKSAACPNLTFNAPAKQFALDYGSGCAGKDGKTRSGSITVQYSGKLSTGATLTLTFNNYKTSNKTFSGQMVATISNSNTVALVINNATVADDNGSATVNGNLTMTVNLNNTPQNLDDDVYLFSGSGNVVENGKTYGYNITEPLRIQPGCNFPTSGKMTVSTQNSPDTAIDFFPENGACDDVALMTIGNVSKKINLGS